MVDALPWLADGITEWEELAIDSLRTISSIDTESTALILSFPWVVDDISSSNEMSAITLMRDMMNEHPDFAREVLGFQWVQDDMTAAEYYALGSLRDLARNNLALARQVIKEPFMEPPFLQRDEYALDVLRSLSFSETVTLHVEDDQRVSATTGSNERGSGLLAQIVSQSWFSDGLDDQEAALLHAIALITDDFREALFETHYVESKSVTLPLAGVVGLAVVRHTPFPPDDDTLATLEEAVRLMEDFMGAPLPVGDVVLLLVEPEFWNLPGVGNLYRFSQTSHSYVVEPVYIRSIMRIRNTESGPPIRTLYHELGHYYLENGSRWLKEGLANFLEAYVVAQTGGQELEARLAQLESYGRCKENIWQHVNPYRGGQCNYELGEKFLLGMYVALGPEAVSAALRELYTQALIFEQPNHDSIYYAFLSNAPHGKEEAFRTAYRRYHGGPLVDLILADSPDLQPLVALYNATNGDYWVNNRNWVSDAPLGAWYGVYTNSRSQVTGLELNEKSLVGGIPPELGNLTNLVELDLRSNELTGEIPPELGNLTNLVDLNLRSNELTGEIPPELGNLANLETLVLDHNGLTGELPPELGKLTNLKSLWLHRNNLSGQIPPELANLTNLEHLLLYGNQFTGCIAAELPEIWVSATGLERCGSADATSP